MRCAIVSTNLRVIIAECLYYNKDDNIYKHGLEKDISKFEASTFNGNPEIFIFILNRVALLQSLMSRCSMA